MVRMQVQLTNEQVTALRRRAADRGVSVAALVREAVDQDLERSLTDRRWERAIAAAGVGHSEHIDISVRHDDYLAEDFAE